MLGHDCNFICLRVGDAEHSDSDGNEVDDGEMLSRLGISQ